MPPAIQQPVPARPTTAASPRRRAARILAPLALTAVFIACAPAGPAHHEASLAALRRTAHARAADPLAQRDAALAELVAPGGDPVAGVRDLARLRAPLSGDPRVRFGLGLAAMQRGEFARAAEDLAATIEAARTRRDPLGPALAEVAVGKLIALRGNVRDFAGVFRPVIDAVVRDPGYLGAEATSEIVETATRWARERGLAEEAARWVRAAGCVTEWTVLGAFGPLPMLRFDDHLGPEDPGPLAHDYELGPGRGRRPGWTIRARGCAANLGRGRSDAGVFFAATDAVLERDADVVLTVESPNVFDVLVDAVKVATLDGRTRPTGTSVSVPLHLAAGRHTLRVKIASRYSSPLLVATLTDPHGRAVARFEPARGGAHETPPAVPPVTTDLARAGLSDPPDPFARYVASELAFARHDPVAAREVLRPLTTSNRATPASLIAWGAVALADSFTAPGVARDRARRAFESARRAEPAAYFPYLALARLAQADDRAEQSLALVREAYARFPDNPEVQSDLIDQLLDRNWDGEAAEIVARAQRALPEACWPARVALTLAQRHADGAAEGAIAARIPQCDALSDAAAITAVRQRRWGAAAGEFARLLGGDPEGRGLRRALVDVQRQRGDVEGAARAAAEILGENPEDTSLRSDLTDMLLARGRRAEALALLDRELAAQPAVMTELYRTRAALVGREELTPWRLDGREVLRAFEASGHTYDSSSVLVLDYTVRRVMPDGSALELTHNIIRLQSQEGVDEHATLDNLPQGAMLLTLRTHKADGRVLEPDAIARLDAVAFPDVHIGDAIEFEYVRAIEPDDTAPGGFDTERFYFRGFSEPYDRSELVVVVPRELAARAVVDPRGPAPTLARRELAGGALTEFRWVARESRRLTPEPRAIAPREFIPSVALGAGASWERYVDALRDRLADMNPYDPEAARITREVVGRARRPSEKLARLHRWVLDHIDQEGAGTPFASAPVMLSARSGHRARVLCYMLGLEDIPCRLALVRQGNGDQTPGRLADEDTYASVLLRVTTEQGERWVTASDRGAPVGFVPPVLAGQPALLLERGAPRASVPAFDPAAHTREVTVHLTLAADGSARGEVAERMHGSWAVSWREQLRAIDPANLEREFENYVGRQVTAASLTQLRIEGQDDPEADLVLRYSFTAPNVATVTAGGLAFDGIFPAELGPTYAQVPQRTTTMYNAEPLAASFELTVDVPAEAGAPELPASRQGHAPGVEWSTRYERTRGGFRYTRTLRVPPGRISPQAYPAFAAQIRAADTADTQRVIIARR